MPACRAPHCPRAATCGRHDPQSRHVVDYSHGLWFEPDACFWFLPKQPQQPSLLRRMAGLYGGRTLT